MSEEPSDSQILLALEDLPQDLPQTFERVLRRSSTSGNRTLARQIFRWVAVAKRPLYVEELREAIGIEPLQDSWDAKRFPNDMKKAIASCSNLIFLDEEQQTIHFTHNSVKQYLLSEDVKQSLGYYYIDMEKAEADAGAVCVTYLNFGIFDTQLDRTLGSSIGISGVPSTIIRRSLPSGNRMNRIALDLLHRKNKSDKSIDRQLQAAFSNAGACRQQSPLDHSFLQYAKLFWLEHTRQEFVPSKGKLWILWRNLLEQAGRRNILLGVPWTYEDWQKRDSSIFEWIIAKNHCSMAQLLMTGEDELELYDCTCLVRGAAAKGYSRLLQICLDSERVPKVALNSALQSAAGAGQQNAVLQLLSAQADVNGPRFMLRESTPLQAAAEGGCFSIVDMLLEQNAEVNAEPCPALQRTALQAAAGLGHVAVVERLLEAKAVVNAEGVDLGGRTALQAASENGNLVIVDKLLEAGAEVGMVAVERYGRTALQAAAECGHTAVVDRLLQVGADVNIPAVDYDGRTALQAAAGEGHLAVVERLLQAGADVNSPTGEVRGRTALQAAAGEGHFAVVERLLQAGADVNAAPALEVGRTALQAAAEFGHPAMVERLLREGANINAAAVECGGRTALQAAAEQGHIAMVDRLLQAGADIHGPAGDWRGRTAIQAAASNGHLVVVERLLREGADVNAPASKHSRTALQAASAGGYAEVVETLRKAGATAKSQ